jgi:MFS family permease
MITTSVNVGSTPLSFWAIEKLDRRALLIYGAIGMLVCEFLIGIIGTFAEGSKAASTCLIVFTCMHVFFFATTWGPGAWVLIGEIFPLPIRAKGVALSTASNVSLPCHNTTHPESLLTTTVVLELHHQLHHAVSDE